MKLSAWMTLACVPFLAGVSCQTLPVVTDPCDVLVVIPDAPAHVNALLVRDARPTAEGLAKNKGRVERYRCVDRTKSKR